MSRVRKSVLALLSFTIFISAAFAAFSEVNTKATGYDWVKYSKNEKESYARLIYRTLKVGKKTDVAPFIRLLDEFYSSLEKKYPYPDPEKDRFYKESCINIIGSIMHAAENQNNRNRQK
ncbi:MAG: hypothetical protein JW994_03195 [Candidatus Omnitrophica bacterium]|nr:hypothetical protein [Candidatus Omnitrophota bacterium]